MGNSAGKESRNPSQSQSRPGSMRNGASSTSNALGASSGTPSAGDRLTSNMYGSRTGRASRTDLSFLGIGGNRSQDPVLPERRETKAEREARKLEKERAARVKERERSLKEEGVDGGYLVTLGTYTGTEDFNKAIVRQLMIERRLAPFWRGLNDHSESWTEYQFVAVANGLPLPSADEVLPEDAGQTATPAESSLKPPEININSLTVPITGRSLSSNSDMSQLSPSHPAFSLPSSSPINSPTSPSPFFRGRAKTLAALTTSSKNSSQNDMTPQEIQLPKDPNVNGQRLEAVLYKDASECPICFLYYPPYLNTTRCCEQPICSECFVQIKRPDPHPPEHHDPEDPHSPPPGTEDNQLVSEPSTCPFCKQPELGVTYDPPPFRRGLAYAQAGNGRLGAAASAMSSSTSLISEGLASPGSRTRRRAGSLPPTAPNVITTDRIRPDWAKKLSDARLHAERRSAAATALHNAAYVLGNTNNGDATRGLLSRRRRTLFGNDSPASNSSANVSRPPEELNVASLLAAASSARFNAMQTRSNEGNPDLFPDRQSSRQQRAQDLEELMVAEAIRLSLVAEEERRKKEEREKAKEKAKDEKKQAKEAKKAEKSSRRKSLFGLGSNSSSTSQTLPGSTSDIRGKGKAPERSESAASNSLEGSSSSTELPAPPMTREDSQRHLEQSRSQLYSQPSEPQPNSNNPYANFMASGSHRSALRGLSVGSSSTSSISDSVSGSIGAGNALGSSLDASPDASGLNVSGSGIQSGADTPPAESLEPLVNFTSLADTLGQEKSGTESHHIENTNEISPPAGGHTAESSVFWGEGSAATAISASDADHCASDMETSMVTVRPDDDGPEIAPLQHTSTTASNQFDQKHYGDVSLLESTQDAPRALQ